MFCQLEQVWPKRNIFKFMERQVISNAVNFYLYVAKEVTTIENGLMLSTNLARVNSLARS